MAAGMPEERMGMKLVKLTAVLLAAGIAAVCVFLLIVPGDTVTNRYTSLRDARQDGVFDKGWLPDVLPPTAFGIEVSNNLDLNVSSGEFSFDPADYPFFIEQTRPWQAAGVAPARETENSLDKRQAVAHGSIWTFRCDGREGRCKYDMRQHSPE